MYRRIDWTDEFFYRLVRRAELEVTQEETQTARCDGCGLAIPGGSASCQAILDEFLARDFSDVAYFRVHRMMVDTYALQHPERYCKSSKSLAAHLVGLCFLLETESKVKAVGSKWIQQWLSGPSRIEKPSLPIFRGRLTIGDVRTASDPKAYGAAVEHWARSTWEAYVSLHGIARKWLRESIGNHNKTPNIG